MSHSAAKIKLYKKRTITPVRTKNDMSWTEFKRRVAAHKMPSASVVQISFRNRKTNTEK